MTTLRWVAFGELDPAQWGAAVIRAEAGSGHVVLGDGGDSAVFGAELDASEDAWRLRGDGLELAIAGTGEDTPDRATGSFTLDGREHEVDAAASREALSDPGELDSLRLLAAWFDRDEALTLGAVRPRGARGQEGERILTSLLESGQARTVIDPRLSTTYAGDGQPTRAGVELWVSEPSEDSETTNERPYRIAGEAAAPGTTWREGDLELSAYPFRCHSHGRDGAGVYVLGRPG